jgi:hypothetical protein
MRFDGKSTGLFSDEEPKKKKKRRIKITEEQYNRLFTIMEQDYQLTRGYDTPTPASTTAISQEYLGYPELKFKNFDPLDIKKELDEKGLDDSDDSIDFIIDVASAALDVIPGVGNAASFVIDVLHSISYFIRANNSSDEVEKVEKYIFGFITAAFAFIPFGGNAASIVAKQGVRSFIKMALYTGKQHAIRLGFKEGFYLLKWKFSFLLFLEKLFGEQLRDTLTEISDSLVEIKNAIEDTLTGDWIGDPLGVRSKLKFIDDLIKTLEDIKPYIDDVKEVYQSLKSENLINEEDEGGEDTSSSSGGGGGSVWTSGASSYTNITRGKANPIGNTSWSSGVSSYKNITRGKANPL